jgi:hypothetical protein
MRYQVQRRWAASVSAEFLKLRLKRGWREELASEEAAAATRTLTREVPANFNQMDVCGIGISFSHGISKTKERGQGVFCPRSNSCAM